ncbi:MAG: hypothetical protein A2787_05535 [Omnitrophica WOR_2 bacterium RIFCSPHIGHO2_01_FULL_48_9]|nr:MAG: hypothetical protein A3D10_07780 [Omnitrophica WOR_2 bacterium RIFCSPHIGHO2_02_FULL_48_11]OGX32864.1 MAG: hypothetical protein A2787_05535 [Omnitrophica WOR_2 bacterium RIFCSPHIGHO2_01_FULL_48_9]
MNIIDTHTHLDHLEDIEGALRRAQQAGVAAIVAVGVDLAANKRNLEIKRATQQPKIYVALGIHPGNINPAEVAATLKFIRENIKEVVAIGETGLDYWYKWVKKDEAKKQEQRATFQKQLELAKEFDLPVVIHSRGAWRDCLSMTQQAGVKKALFHWYSGPVDILQEILAGGYYVSTSPSVAYSPQSREAMAAAPIERTLIETDSPVYYGEKDKGFLAEPKDVFRTLQAYAELKKVPEEKALNILNQNAKDFFALQDLNLRSSST